MQEDKQNTSQSWSNIAKGLVALFFVCFIAISLAGLFAVYVLPCIVSLFSPLSMLDTGVLVALITGVISIVTVVGGGVINNRMKRNEYLYRHREVPYLQLISMFYDLQRRTNEGKDFSQEELIEIYTQITKDLTLWGSSNAIKIWGKWRISSSRKNVNPRDLLFGMEEVMIQLRKDMGLRRGIKKGDILRLSINDIDDYLN